MCFLLKKVISYRIQMSNGAFPKLRRQIAQNAYENLLMHHLTPESYCIKRRASHPPKNEILFLTRYTCYTFYPIIIPIQNL